jgi:hypothetical protein
MGYVIYMYGMIAGSRSNIHIISACISIHLQKYPYLSATVHNSSSYCYSCIINTQYHDVKSQLSRQTTDNHPLLPTFNGLGFYLDALGGELNSYRGLGVEVELVPSEARQQIGLPHAGVSDQDN